MEHNLSETLHNSLPITVLLFLSSVKINGQIITASDTVSQPVFPRPSPAYVSNGVTLWVITQILLSPTNTLWLLCSPSDLCFSASFSQHISGAPWGMPHLPLNKAAPWSTVLTLGMQWPPEHIWCPTIFSVPYGLLLIPWHLSLGTAPNHWALLVPSCVVVCGKIMENQYLSLCYSMLCVCNLSCLHHEVLQPF